MNDTLDFSGFYSGYDIPTWNKIAVGEYIIGANEYVSIGNSGDTDNLFDDDHKLIDADFVGGIYFNRELYNYKKLFKEEGKERYAYLSNAALTKEISEDQLSTIIKVHNENNSYNFLNHNCTYVACLAWNTAFNDDLDSIGIFIYMVNDGTRMEPHFKTAYLPKVLKKSIMKNSNATTEFDIGKLFYD